MLSKTPFTGNVETVERMVSDIFGITANINPNELDGNYGLFENACEWVRNNYPIVFGEIFNLDDSEDVTNLDLQGGK